MREKKYIKNLWHEGDVYLGRNTHRVVGGGGGGSPTGKFDWVIVGAHKRYEKPILTETVKDNAT